MGGGDERGRGAVRFRCGRTRGAGSRAARIHSSPGDNLRSRPPTRHPLGMLLLALIAAFGCGLEAAPLWAQGDVIVPNQMHKSLTFELHSVKDQVTLYEGDPQFLLRLDL